MKLPPISRRTYNLLRKACQVAFDEVAADNKNQPLIDQLDRALTAHLRDQHKAPAKA